MNALTTKPDNSKWAAYDAFFIAAKANTAVWNQIVELYLTTGEQSPLVTKEVNAKTPGTFDGTLTGGFTRTPGVGVVFDGLSTSFIGGNGTPTGIGASQNNFMLGGYTTSNIVVSGSIAAVNGGNSFIFPRSAGDLAVYRINATSGTKSVATTNGANCSAVNRISSTIIKGFQRGVNIGQASQGSVAPTAANIVYGQGFTGNVTSGFAGLGMTDQAQADLSALLDNLFIALGLVPEITISEQPVMMNATADVTGASTTPITISGTYIGAVAAIQVQLVDGDTGVTVVDWTTHVATPSGNAWSAAFAVPKYNGYLKANARKGSSSVASQANKWANSYNVLLDGQSNMRFMWGDLKRTPLTPNALTRRWSGAGWWSPELDKQAGETASNQGSDGFGGDGSVLFSDLLQQGVGMPVGIFTLAIGSTTIATHQPSAGTSYVTANSAINTVGGGGWANVNAVLWHQGESDVGSATYQTDLETLINAHRTKIGNASAPYGVAILGAHAAGGTPGDYDLVRTAEMNTIAANTAGNIFWAGSSVDSVIGDGVVHWNAVSYRHMARRYVQALLKKLGFVATGSNGPKITSATCAIGSNLLKVFCTHDAGTVLKDLTGNATSTTVQGFDVEVDTTVRTITSASIVSATEIDLVFNGAVAVSAAKVAYQRGYNDNTGGAINFVYDNFLPQGDTIGLPLQPSSGQISAVVS